MSIKLGGTGLIENKLKWIMGTHGHWKNQNPGGRFGTTSWTALPIQPIYRENGPNGQNWQCCLAGSSETTPTILIFSIAIGADISFELISNVHWVPQFFMHNKSILGGVQHMQLLKFSKILCDLNKCSFTMRIVRSLLTLHNNYSLRKWQTCHLKRIIQ